MTLSLKPAIVFAPHQDDETLGCGGAIALKREQGVPVAVVFLTDGKASHLNHPKVNSEELVETRKQEAVTALTTLGVKPSEIHFLDQSDGSLSHLNATQHQHLLDQVIQLLQSFNPQEVYVPYRKDIHPDHEATYALVQAAILKSNLQVELLQYPVWTRWNACEFDLKSQDLANSYRLPIAPVRNKKIKALEAYRSQYLPLFPEVPTPLPPGFLRRFFAPYEVFFRVGAK
jgi:LmbE family N-acetylglucosaminyl deacetylase